MRESMNLSKNQLSKLSGVSQSYISDIELNKKNPTLDILERLCKALGITVAQFLQDSDENQLPHDLIQLIETTKKLPQEERKALNEYLKVRLSFMNEISAAKEETNVASLVAESGAKYAEKEEKIIYEIPLVGASAAGSPMTAIGYYEGHFRAPSNWGDFALRVKGDSMEPLIPDKGFVFVRQQEEINNNEIALVKVFGSVEDEVTIKRVRFQGEKVRLISENPEYQTMEYYLREVKILGKVVKWLSATEGNRYLKEHI